jgi:hypothetical protein
MAFDPTTYGPEVAALLALDGGGERLMPLAQGTCSSARARELLKGTNPGKLFPGTRSPQGALAGMYLYFSCLDECHSIAQEIPTAEGSFWHGILHRQEPDPGNASYWFRQVGAHPIFPELRSAAAAAGLDFGPRWDPFRFIEYCEDARAHPATGKKNIAEVVQRAEWQLLFHYCAVPA